MKPDIPIGTRFGHLQVIGSSLPVEKDGHNNAASVVKCDCGNVVVMINSFLRTRGRKVCSTSCPLRNFKHGFSRSRLYRTWQDMIFRCTHDKPEFKDYYGRGIKVCEEWLSGFMPFRNWAVSNGYTDELTIDRIDPNGNYEPSNCRWTTKKVQSGNRRISTNVTYRGKTKNVAEWARITGLPRGTIWHRIKDLGWDVEKALTTPIKQTKETKDNEHR